MKKQERWEKISYKIIEKHKLFEKHNYPIGNIPPLDKYLHKYCVAFRYLNTIGITHYNSEFIRQSQEPFQFILDDVDYRIERDLPPHDNRYILRKYKLLNTLNTSDKPIGARYFWVYVTDPNEIIKVFEYLTEKV